MSWLFTQVWLWSLAAFALGSLLTWWLFVRPLKRELRELAPRVAEHPEEAWESAPSDEEAPLDLLRDPEERWYPDERGYPDERWDNERWDNERGDERTDDELNVVREADGPTFGDWDRPSRWGPYGRGGWNDDSAPRLEQQREPGVGERDEERVAQPVVGHPTSAPTVGPEVDQGGGAVSGSPERSGDDEAELAGGGGRNTWFRNDDPDLSSQLDLSSQPDESSQAHASPESYETPESYEWSGTLEVPADDDGSGPAEHDRPISGTEASEGDVSSDTQRFSNVREATGSDPSRSPDQTSSGDEADPADDTGGSVSSGESDEDKSARLRSLFEPAVLPGDQHRDAAMPDAATQHIPRVEAESSSGGESGEDELRGDQSDGSSTRQDEHGESEHGEERGAALPRRTPGAGPNPGARKVDGPPRATASAADFGGGLGHMIKGHFPSQQYHTPDSPQYDRIVAEVWFRTAADAEQAGFEPWDRGPRPAEN